MRVETGDSYSDLDCHGELWERNSAWLVQPDAVISPWHLPVLRRLGYGYSVCDLGMVSIQPERAGELAEQLAAAMPESTQRGGKFKLLQVQDARTPLCRQQPARATLLVVWNNPESALECAEGVTFGELCASREYTEHMSACVAQRARLAARVLQGLDILPEHCVLSADRSRVYTYQDVNTCHLQPLNGQICVVSDYHLPSQSCAVVDHGCHTGCTMVVSREAHRQITAPAGAPATDPMECSDTEPEQLLARFDDLVRRDPLPAHVAVGAHPPNQTRLVPIDATVTERRATLLSDYLHRFGPADVLMCSVVAAAYPSPVCPAEKLYALRQLDIRGALRHRHPNETHLRIPQTPHWVNLLMQTFSGSRLFELMNKDNARTHPEDPHTVLGYDIPIEKVDDA